MGPDVRKHMFPKYLETWLLTVAQDSSRRSKLTSFGNPRNDYLMRYQIAADGNGYAAFVDATHG